MKKILYFVTEDWYFVSHRLPLAKAAQEKGYEVAVITKINQHKEVIEKEGITVFPIHMERRSLNPFSALKTFCELRKILKNYKPDLIHLVALKPILLGNLAALTRKTIVINAFTGMGFLYSSTKFYHKIIRNLFFILYRFMFGMNKAHVIVQNKDDHALFAEKKTLPLDRIHIIKGSGVNIDAYDPTSRTTVGSLKALLVARALKDKGIREYVEAAKLLKNNNINLIFQFAGIPDPQNPTSLKEEELQTWHDEGLIEWKGYQENIPALWAQADIAVLPSYREGLPKTLLEAAAAGKPIVATDVPGCREICQNNVNGILVEPNSARALANALEKLVMDQDLRLEMGKASRKLVEKDLSVEAVNKATLELYRRQLMNAVPLQ